MRKKRNSNQMEQKHSFRIIFLRIAGISVSVRGKKSKPFKRFVQILSSQGKNTRSDQITDHQTGGPYDTFFLEITHNSSSR